MITAAATTARGMVRRASRISSPIVDALSTPPKANAIVDQKITSFRLVLGMSDAVSIGVADPKRDQDTAPSVINRPATIHAATPPALFSHLPMSGPRTFTGRANASPIIEAGRGE